MNKKQNKENIPIKNQSYNSTLRNSSSFSNLKYSLTKNNFPEFPI